MHRPLVLLLVVVALAACSKGAVDTLPPAPELPPTTTTTPPPDLTGVALPDVPGRTTTTAPLVAVPGARAALTGLVRTVEGAIPGAVVQAERIVGDAVGRVQVTTGPDGRFAMLGILGGRYRVRAWKPAPDNLALTKPFVFFLNGDENRVLDLPVERFQGIAVDSDIAPDPPIVDQRSALVVQVTQRSVDGNGFVRGVPVTGTPVTLGGAGAWQILSPNPSTTDAGGRIRFELRCLEEGTQPLSAQLGDGQVFPLRIPACATFAPPPTTTTTTSGPPSTTTTTAPTSTTSTTRRGGR